MRSLMLDLDEWDLVLDPAGHIALCEGPYAIAQNVANAVRLFRDDAYYDPRRGVPHFQADLGHRPNGNLLRRLYRDAAMTVEGVKDATVELRADPERTLGGDIRLTLTDGGTATVAL